MKRLALIAIAILTPMFALADSYYVKPLTGAGVPKEEVESIQELVSMGVRSAGGQVSEQAQGADATIEGKVVKLGSAYVLSLKKVKNGQTVFAEQARANSLEDMDTVSSRVARAVVKETKFKDDARIGDVTQDEVDRPVRRKQAVRQWDIGFGPAFFNNLGVDKSGFMWKLGRVWGVEDQFAIRFALTGTFGKDTNAGTTDIAIGVDYFFTDRDIAPFIGADFGYGSAAGDDQNATLLNVSKDRTSGFIAAVDAGVKFFRTSQVNMGLNARHVRWFETTSRGTPAVTSVNVAVYF